MLPKPKFETRVIEKDRLYCQICFISCLKNIREYFISCLKNIRDEINWKKLLNKLQILLRKMEKP